MAQPVRSLVAMQETRVRSLGWEDPLEKEMATRSTILGWRIPWTEEPCSLQLMGSLRVGHGWASIIGHTRNLGDILYNFHCLHTQTTSSDDSDSLISLTFLYSPSFSDSIWTLFKLPTSHLAEESFKMHMSDVSFLPGNPLFAPHSFHGNT